MANNSGDDFLDQILGYQSYVDGAGASGTAAMVHLSSGDVGYDAGVFPLGLSLAGTGFGNVGFRDDVADGHVVPPPSLNYAFSGQPMPNTVSAMPHQPATRPRVRARRGQATDPHSIAERLRRGRIAERNKALQDLVPSVNKVLSMSRLGGASAVAPLVTNIPTSSMEDKNGEGVVSQPAWEKWSTDGTEKQVAKLMEENVGAAMQFLQSKSLCIMPISLASTIYHTQLPDSTSIVKPETYPPS